MAIKIAQTQTGTSTLASTPIVWANNTVSGNLIIVAVVNTSASAGNVSGISDSQGNVYTKIFATENGGTTADVELWYAKNILGGTTPTITVAYTAGVTAAAIAREYSGLETVTSLTQNDGLATGNTNAPTSNTIKVTNKPSLLIGVTGCPSTTPSAGGSFVNLTTITNTDTIAIEDLYVTSTGSYSATFSDSGTVQWVAGIVAFNESPHGTTTSTSSTSVSSTSSSTSSTSVSSTSSSTSSTSSSTSSTSTSFSTSSTSSSFSITTMSTSSTSSSISSTSMSSTSSSTSVSSTSSSISSTSFSSTSMSSTSSSTSVSSTSSSFSSTSSSISSTSSSTSSTSFSSTSSSSSTSTTTLPPPNLNFTYLDEATYTVVRQFGPVAPSTWVCPANVTSVLVECWGGGGGGGGADTGTNGGGGGGGGGGYSSKTITVTPGTSYTVTVGAAGAAGVGGPGAINGGTGGDSWFSSSATVLAKGGGPGNAGSPDGTFAGGAGGAAGSGVGTITTSGGSGGNGITAEGGGGGGGGGSLGSGSNGGVGVAGGGLGGAAGPAVGGLGGNGGDGPGINNATNSTGPGGGGGGGGNAATNSSDGSAGLVQLTYTVTQNPQTTSTDLADRFTAVNYGNVLVDDGDYLVTYGSESMIQEFKKTWVNNSDFPKIQVKLRTTQSTVTSPVLLQIYNQNSAAWETLDKETLQLADTDFFLSGAVTTNASNYYDSNKVVTFRVYQQVI